MRQQILESATFLRKQFLRQPEIGLVLGSGLGPLAEELQDAVYIPYGMIPHFKQSTAPDHAGQLVCGQLAGKTVLCMQGRLHGYEGHTPAEIAYPVYVLKELGVRALLLTNASGGINTDFAVGDLMLIEDHINMTGQSPLTGINDDALGTRFPDMTFAYCPELRKTALQVAEQSGVKLQRGVYCGVNGPQFETPAEIRAFRTLGADAVGMSTVFEVIAAAHCGLPLAAVAMITNMAAGVLMKPLSGAEVNEIAEQKGKAFRQFMTAWISSIAF
ncbi:purine-nucleoside phosphorylase [Agathobaculum sp.]|uniref:purine-nucleoside phosphorylase n=1 Tax=Agathobaculum sp. TaxID=2048138 RepID=UPI002A811B9D|nr:purine-nucleoside phosphorylase [Agathobaculum sp.]MDY3617939.1 purine-nucleoside phosphorylase [Agathobaculum sp.]